MEYVGKFEPFDVNEKRAVYRCGDLFYITTTAGSVLADHTHEQAETLWIISGEAEIQVEEVVEAAAAPCTVEIPSNAYHKFTAKTDVKFIEKRHS